MTTLERDYIAEMDERIAAATAGSGWVAAVVAQKLHAALLESDPDLLDGWLRAMAVQMLRRVIGLKGSQERSAARRGRGCGLSASPPAASRMPQRGRSGMRPPPLCSGCSARRTLSTRTALASAPPT